MSMFKLYHGNVFSIGSSMQCCIFVVATDNYLLLPVKAICDTFNHIFFRCLWPGQAIWDTFNLSFFRCLWPGQAIWDTFNLSFFRCHWPKQVIWDTFNHIFFRCLWPKFIKSPLTAQKKKI
jgi:hypothetical protein